MTTSLSNNEHCVRFDGIYGIDDLESFKVIDTVNAVKTVESRLEVI